MGSDNKSSLSVDVRFTINQLGTLKLVFIDMWSLSTGGLLGRFNS